MFKKSLIAAALLGFGISAEAAPAKVMSVEPIYGTVTKHVNKEVEIEKCSAGGRESKGWIERGTNNVFGSTAGMIGAVVGGVVGNELGDKIDNRNARRAVTTVGTAWGNRIGNDISNRRNRDCYPVIRERRVPIEVTEVVAYRVFVDVNGAVVPVRRSFEPAVGSNIDVTLTAE